MKTKSYKILTLLLITTLISCDSFLTKEPISQLTQASFWKTEKDANVGVIAIYSAFSKAMASGLWDWGELRSDNFVANNKNAFDQQELTGNYILIDNQAANWKNLYDVIGKANAAIKYIPSIEMSPVLKNHYLGEAYAMRAWAYFYCVRVWGDVPLYIDPIEEISQGIYRERTSKDIILNNVVLPDLEQAYYLIDKSNTNRIRMNVATVCALMMDVNAWMHNYENVIKIKEEKVNSLSTSNWVLVNYGGNSFDAEWRAMFIESVAGSIPNEVFFKIAYDQFGNGVNKSVSYFGSSSSLVYMSNSLLNVYESTDKRSSCQWLSTGTERRMTKKFWKDGAVFQNSENKEMSDNDLVLYRYADITLLYAEALNEVGRTFDAIEYLNMTRTRAGNAPYLYSSFGTKTQVLDAILNERRKEFVGEGKRWFDLIRTNRWKEIMHPINNMSEEWQILFPIHRDHLIQNINIKQNPGYQGI